MDRAGSIESVFRIFIPSDEKYTELFNNTVDAYKKSTNFEEFYYNCMSLKNDGRDVMDPNYIKYELFNEDGSKDLPESYMRYIRHLDPSINMNYIQNLHNERLQRAVANGDIETIEVVLQEGADLEPGEVGRNYFNPLKTAIEMRNTDVVRYLLSKGANPNARDSLGNTPLMIAAHTGNREIIAALVYADADMHAQKLGTTVLELIKNDRETAEFLSLLIKNSHAVGLFKILYRKFIYLGLETIFELVNTLVEEKMAPCPEKQEDDAWGGRRKTHKRKNKKNKTRSKGQIKKVNRQ